ncbi:prefoldin, alpha subunit [Methanosalsum zhilinae DSM 4017]|uniref:Prefoldin subunit alpha n=1 Tax=Methanosalsum zhilinae (strain DSM 4017 / NBRC 107636 / OCM 62 / WeN5) TaxID=679901 RepID=F7XQ47_METZD|nr:prefoldin subunit alpha [Methanosalsum zhilinae]AEH60408.1 prefoldin, alpha subunit [Methanosalsum zhilinae DSM 4017]
MSQLSEQEARNLLMQHREYKARLDTLQQQIGAVQMHMDDCVRAINTINELKDSDEDVNTMIPIGSESFLHARLTKPDTVVVNIGAGISVEKSLDEAIESLNLRKKEFEKTLEQLQGSLEQITKKVQEIESEFEKYSQQQQQQQAGYYSGN